MAVSDILIHELGLQGDGVHIGPHGRVYVDRALPGELVRAQIARDSQSILRGEVTQVLSASKHRQAPPCDHYSRCGGCTLQHLKEKTYQQWKTEKVQQHFYSQRLKPRQWLPTVFLGNHNRRRATFALAKVGSQTQMGYYRRRSQEIFDVRDCLVLDRSLLELKNLVKPALGELLKEGELIHVFFQKGTHATEMLLTGPMGKSGRPNPKAWEKIRSLGESGLFVRIAWRLDEQSTPEVVFEMAPLLVRFGDLEVNLPIGAFLQPTGEGETALVAAVMQAVPTRGKFADLFSGCGTFSGPLVARGSVEAFESEPQAVKALGRAARSFPLRAFKRDLYRNPLRREELNRYDAVVFDPPRAGCLEQVLQLATSKVGTLVGVSCNPATFARDAKVLCDGGYWLQSVQVIDQFSWSHHVEVVAVFTKQKRRKPESLRGREVV